MATKKTRRSRNPGVEVRESTIGTGGGDIVGRNKLHIENFTNFTVLLRELPSNESLTTHDQSVQDPRV